MCTAASLVRSCLGAALGSQADELVQPLPGPARSRGSSLAGALQLKQAAAAGRVWSICVQPGVRHVQTQGFSWLLKVAQTWRLTLAELLPLLDEQVARLSPDLCLTGWACLLTLFQQVQRCPALVWLAAM